MGIESYGATHASEALKVVPTVDPTVEPLGASKVAKEDADTTTAKV